MKKIKSQKQLIALIDEYNQNDLPFAHIFTEYEIDDAIIKELNKILFEDELADFNRVNKKVEELYKNYPSTKDEILKLTHYLPRKIISQYFADTKVFEDLISLGLEGLLIAVDEYSRKREGDFVSFASSHIIQNVIKRYTELNNQSYKEYIENKSEFVSYESLKGNEPEEMVDDYSLYDISERNNVREIILQILNDDFPPRDKRVIEYRYGFIDGIFHTMADTAKQLDITIEMVRNSEARVLKKLKHPRYYHMLKEYLGEYETFRK